MVMSPQFFGIGKLAGHRHFGRFKRYLLLPVVGGLRQPVMVFYIIQDLSFLDLQGIIQLVDENIMHCKIIADTAQKQGQDAGEDVDTAISGKKLQDCNLANYPVMGRLQFLTAFSGSGQAGYGRVI